MLEVSWGSRRGLNEGREDDLLCTCVKVSRNK